MADKAAAEAMQTWVAERMPGRQAAQRIEKPSRGSQRAISDEQEPREERWRRKRDVRHEREQVTEEERGRTETQVAEAAGASIQQHT